MSGLDGLGNMIGGAIGSIFGGPAGAKIGSMIGSAIGQIVQKLIGQFGMNNVAGGLANCLNQDFANTAFQYIGNSGAPKQLQDRMNACATQWLKDNMHNVPSACQNKCNDVYIQINNSNNSNSSTGNVDDAVMRGCQGVNDLDKKESKDGAEGGSQNWLVALAKALAEIQTKFLDAAMKNLETMKANADAMDSSAEEGGKKTNGTGGQNTNGTRESSGRGEQSTSGTDKSTSSRGAFLQAQSEFQANFQMFNMMANMTATSIKSLGEGLTAIARKQ